ncbi:hypothetical protein PYW07_005935 [Mythimna separata]|uniref:Uncharacterized protein n=1 Tax=Mythimna separata TaxID=271217 RepID=A0AAD8DSK0_MYTSE|nr:hypothetical protein PYW07_005935 [Mythimna separata]
MKFFAVLAILVAVAAADYSTWTLLQLYDATQDPNTDPANLPAIEIALSNMLDALIAQTQNDTNTVDLTGWTLHDLTVAMQNPANDPALKPYLKEALHEMMGVIADGNPVDTVGAPIQHMEMSIWTVQELSDALQNPDTDPALIPYLEHALNEIMDALYSGKQMESIAIVAPAGLAPAKSEQPMAESVWTLQELSDALQSPDTDPALIPYLEHALNEIMDALYSGKQMESIAIVAPAGLAPAKPEQEAVSAPIDPLKVTFWSVTELSDALQNPATNPVLIPYLEHALNEIMNALYSGKQMESIAIVAPADLTPVKPKQDTVGAPIKPLEMSIWSVQELSDALQNSATDPALIPYLEHAVNAIMDALFSGNQMESIAIVAPAGLAPAKSEQEAVSAPIDPLKVTYWSVTELSDALQNPDTNPVLIPYLEHALNEIMNALYSGKQMESIAIVAPADLTPVKPKQDTVGASIKPMEMSIWTVQDLSDALQNPDIDPALIPYLEHAVNAIMDALYSGNQMESIAIVAPTSLAPVKQVLEPVELSPEVATTNDQQ